jgi:hypothetical protein
MAILKNQSSIEARRQHWISSTPTGIGIGTWIAALCLGIAMTNNGTAAAQAIPTASRSFAMALFAQGTYMMQPGYSQAANFGFAAGLNITPPIMFRAFQPSLALRATGDSGPAARE